MADGRRPPAKRTPARGRPPARKVGASSSGRTSPKSKRSTTSRARPAGEHAKPRVNTRIARRNHDVAREAGRRRLWIVTSLLAVPALIVSVFLILHSSLFSISGVTVHGAKETQQAAVISAAGLSHHPPLIDVNPVAVALKVEGLPWIETATVVRHWPKRVTITVTERTPIAQALITKSRWELFDTQGRALGDRSHPTPGLIDIARVLSMPSPGVTAGGDLEAEVALCDALPVSMIPSVTQIGVTKHDGLVLDIAAKTTVIFGTREQLRDKVVALATLLANHVGLTGVATVDLRVPSSPILSS